MKIRYEMTSLLAYKNVKKFSAENPNQAFAFGSEVPCSAIFRSVRRFGYSTSLHTTMCNFSIHT